MYNPKKQLSLLVHLSALTLSVTSPTSFTHAASSPHLALAFWFSAHKTYSVEGMMTAVLTRVLTAGISPKISAPTAADHISSVYLKGASADASTNEKDLSRQNSSRLAPAPSSASRPSWGSVGVTRDKGHPHPTRGNITYTTHTML